MRVYLGRQQLYGNHDCTMLCRCNISRGSKGQHLRVSIQICCLQN